MAGIATFSLMMLAFAMMAVIRHRANDVTPPKD